MNEILERLGLTKGESKIYVALLKKGPLTKTKIAKESEVSSSKIYEIAEKLHKKGLISKFTKNKVIHYDANTPEKLNDLAKGKINEVKKIQEEIQKIIPQLKKEYKQEQTTSTIELYEGEEGLKTAVKELFENAKEKTEICGIGFQTKDHLLRDFHNKRTKKQISERMIFPPSTPITNYSQKEIRFLEKIGNIGIGINEERVLFSEPKGQTTIVWKDKNAAKEMKKIFELLWKQAK